MVSHTIVPFIEISTLFLLANLFLQYNIGASVDDVATYISQAQENFVVAWKYSSVGVNIHSKKRTQRVLSSIGTTYL